MSQFIELTDYDASIHREILDALTREDESIVEICEDRTLAEMRGYLSRRYDCDRLFAATGQERNQLVLMMAVDITVYHIFCIHNPRNMSSVRKDRYDRAKEWLEAVADGNISIDGAPLLPQEERRTRSGFIIKATVNVQTIFKSWEEERKYRAHHRRRELAPAGHHGHADHRTHAAQTFRHRHRRHDGGHPRLRKRGLLTPVQIV